jgi:trimeric autotransporter adhesin
MFDPATDSWSAMVSPSAMIPDSKVSVLTALGVLPNNDLVVAGRMWGAGGSPGHWIGRWDGATWHLLGTGLVETTFLSSNLPYGVEAMVVMPNGDLIVGGGFYRVGGVTAVGIARWDGTQWTGFGTSGFYAVRALAVLPNGDLIAGGHGDISSGLNPIMRWSGTQWATLGTGVPSVPGSAYTGVVESLAVLTNGDLVVGGSFGTIGGVSSPAIARWSSNAWSAIGGGPVGGSAKSIVEAPGGGLVAAWSNSSVASWNGSAWASLGTDSPVATRLTRMQSGDLMAGGFFDARGGQMRSAARWDGSQWRAMEPSWSGAVNALLRLPDNRLVAGGDFTVADGVPARSLAVWNGSWSEFAGGVTRATGTPRVSSLLRLANGDLVVGGQFTHAGGTPVNNIAVWNGSQWAPLGAGLGANVAALAVRANGNLVAAGSWTWPQSNIAEWDGTSWLPLGSGTNGAVQALLTMPNGDLMVGGVFASAGGMAGTANLALWNGSAWSSVGGGTNGAVHAMTLLPGGWSFPSGSVAVGGDFTLAGSLLCRSVARWTGTTWASMPWLSVPGSVRALHVAPAGYLLVGGNFVVGAQFSGVGYTWPQNGGLWEPIPSGAGPFTTPGVRAIATGLQGNLAIGGSFVSRDGFSSFGFAPIACPYLANVYGPFDCRGPQNFGITLRVSQPWLGMRCQTIATDTFISRSLGIVMVGFASASIPLASLHPAGMPNCNLLVQPAIFDLATRTPTGWGWSFDIPNNSALLGAQVFEQFAEMQFDAGGQITALFTSYGLQLTIGRF